MIGFQLIKQITMDNQTVQEVKCIIECKQCGQAVHITSVLCGDCKALQSLPSTPSGEGEWTENVLKALQELVYLKSIKDMAAYKAEYERRKPIAWANAKKYCVRPLPSIMKADNDKK